jgi:soluble lytic murein transglycosylase
MAGISGKVSIYFHALPRATARLAALIFTTFALPALVHAGAAETLGAAHRAYRAGDYAKAWELSRTLERASLKNKDYALYIGAQSAALLGEHKEALTRFRKLAAWKESRFRAVAAWRVADTLWSLGELSAASDAYRALLKGGGSAGDAGLARFRLAEAAARSGERTAVEAFRNFLVLYPNHALEPLAMVRLAELGTKAPLLTAEQHIARAERMTAQKDWDQAIDELAQVGNEVPPRLQLLRDYWTAMTLFKMRRQYKRASDILLRIYSRMGNLADDALFHGARALSRADFDRDAIPWYLRVAKEYPRSKSAAEAHYLAGWLWFNLSEYTRALPVLRAMRKQYPRSNWAVEALWYEAMSHYLGGELDRALPLFEELAKKKGKLVTDKGRYWRARTLEKLGRKQPAVAEYRSLVGDFPFSWYALLARARLKQQGISIPPFGDHPRDAASAPALADKPGANLVADPLVQRVDELIAAAMGVEAGYELERGESALLKRYPRSRPEVLALLMDRYRKSGTFSRPWMLALVHGERALDMEPTGRARVWWEHAFPLAYREFIERWRHLGENPEFYLYAIMRKESGFDPHTHSYADAQGLLQMIPPTTRRVVRELGLEYSADMLFDPELNVRTGSWYIGRLLLKFKGQIPFGAGSFNCGPGPVMRWMDLNGKRPVDEFVELVSYDQTRNYMRRVTETYARYLYLYKRQVYEQPLEVDAAYLKNDLDY